MRGLTDGAGDEESGVGMTEERRRGVVVKTRNVDHNRVLLPGLQLLLGFQFQFFCFFFCFCCHKFFSHSFESIGVSFPVLLS